jgi:hypothetical protein
MQLINPPERPLNQAGKAAPVLMKKNKAVLDIPV